MTTDPTPDPTTAPGRRRRVGRGWWCVVLAGVVALAVGTGLLVTSRRLPPSFAATPPAQSPAGGPSEPAMASTTVSAPSSPTPPVTSLPVAPFVPTSVTFTAFHVHAAVDPVLTTGGVLNPPDDTSRVGWWSAGSLAHSTRGTTVIVGHVDGPSGPGSLYRLVHARAGDRITVAGNNGSEVTYQVTSLEYHGKGEPLPVSLFATDGPPRLVVVSCGGPFDRSDDEYRDNVVVQAVPL
ncbi:sortase domain-containing protein [Jatrophihabitans sp. YIM 134969]